jgi:GntR family transcriptional regulator, transcriptional repressor for pyruvate dehydrogenase complex
MRRQAGPRNGVSVERVATPATYELVSEQIRRAIHIGTYLPGDKLPAERQLAEQMGVSRTTIREALRVLEGEGYVESRRGATGGIVVLDQSASEERIRPVVVARLAEFEELFDFRLAVEGAAARLAALRRTETDLNHLLKSLDAMEQGWQTARFRAADSAFHLGIADAARNRFMRQAIEDARARMWIPIDSHVDMVFRTANRHHSEILEAIRRRDPDAAEAAAVAHLKTARRDLRRVARAEEPI